MMQQNYLYKGESKQFYIDSNLQASKMNFSSNISTSKNTLSYTYHNQPPLPQKSLKVENSGTYQNFSKNNLVSSGNKLEKKYSYESRLGSDDQKKLGGSCKIIPRQKVVPKSQSTNLISSKVQSIKKNRKSTLKINKNILQSEIKLYEWRVSTHFPIIKVCLIGEKIDIIKKRADRNGLIQVDVFIHWSEDIKYRVGEIDTLNLINSLYILQQSLVGFQRLYNKFGYFQPHIDMIFITNLMKCKLWHNTNIWQNNTENDLPKYKKLHLKVQLFYQKVIRMFVEYFTFMFNNKMEQQTKRNVNLIEKLLYQLGHKQDFIQALKFIHEFLAVYTLKINNRFLDVAQINENKSKIFNKLENTNRSSLKMKTLPAIPISLQIQSQNEEKLMKKISLDCDYPDIQMIINSTNRSNRSRVKQNNEGEQSPQNQQNNENMVLTQKQQQKLNNQSSIQYQKQEPYVKTLKNSTNKQRLHQVTQSNCKTIVINNKKNITHNNRDSKSFKRQSQVSICSKQTYVQKKNRFSMHQQNLNNQNKFQHVKDILPNFTNEDFVQPQDEVYEDENAENQHVENNSHINQKYQVSLSRHQLKALQEDQYQQRVRNQIQKNVMQRNGWLLKPLFLLQTDDCAKSFQDSQPSIKAKIRDRNLSKLNRIKSSIANSIVE